MLASTLSSLGNRIDEPRDAGHIAFVSTLEGATWGGSEELWVAAAEAALRRGIRTTACVCRSSAVPPRVAALARAGARVHTRPLAWRPSLLWRAANRVWRRPSPLLRQLRALPADRLVISLAGAFDLTDDPNVCRLLCASTTPYVLIVQHNFDDPVPQARRAPARDAFRGAALNCFVSASNLLAVERQTAASVPNAVIIQNPINLPDYQAIAWPADETPRFACVARLDTRFKGQDVLFQALASERWRSRPWRLSLYGSGADESYLRALAEHFKIADRVRFCGHSSDVGKIWAEEQLLVLPSRSEGTPLALIEAIVAGRPAVVTDVGDNACWVEPGVTGFVADGYTPTAVANALEGAWARRAEWQRMGNAARRLFLPQLDLQPAQTLLDAVLAIDPCCRLRNAQRSSVSFGDAVIGRNLLRDARTGAQTA